MNFVRICSIVFKIRYRLRGTLRRVVGYFRYFKKGAMSCKQKRTPPYYPLSSDMIESKIEVMYNGFC